MRLLRVLSLVFIIPYTLVKFISLTRLKVGLISIVSGPLVISLRIIVILFLALSLKHVITENKSDILLILILLHLVAFMSDELIVLLLISDFMLCWLCLRFRLYHRTFRSLVSNVYLIFYVLIPSVPLLVFALIDQSKIHDLSLRKSSLLWFLLLLAGLAKLPVFRSHYWLPKAHVQATTFISMLLAGLSLKVGLVLVTVVTQRIEPDTSRCILVLLLIFGISTACYIRVCSVDFKVFLAYCSVGHITIAAVALSIVDSIRIKGAWLIGIRHCLSSPLLFSIVGLSQSITRNRTNLPISRVKTNAVTIILLVALLVDLPFPPVFPFFRELICLGTSYIYIRLPSSVLVLGLIMLLRRYEAIYQSLRRWVTPTSVASVLGVLFTLIARIFIL